MKYSNKESMAGVEDILVKVNLSGEIFNLTPEDKKRPQRTYRLKDLIVKTLM